MSIAARGDPDKRNDTDTLRFQRCGTTAWEHQVPLGFSQATVATSAAAAAVPVTVEEPIGGFSEELLPEESREQWERVIGRRTTCPLVAYNCVSRYSREDVWQETEGSMWHQLEKGPVDQLKAYVRKTCHNEAVAHLKRT